MLGEKKNWEHFKNDTDSKESGRGLYEPII
jgi:hypothetical protein